MGGKTQIQQAAPTPIQAPSTAEAINAYVASLPALYQAQLDYAPREAQQQLDLLQQYGGQYGQAMQDAQRALNPQLTSLTEQLAGQASAGANAGLSPEEEQYYSDQFKSLVGDQVRGGLGASTVAGGLLNTRLQRQDYYRNLGLSLANMQPLSQPQMPNYTNQLGNYSPGQGLNYSQGSFATQSAYNKPQFFQSYKPGFADTFSQIAGGAGGLLLGAGAMM